MLWSGIGINYGYNGTGASPTTDLAYLYGLGFRKVRLFVPDYNNAAQITTWRGLVSTALAQGFTTVIYGLSSNPTTITSVNIATFKTALETEATWAQTLNNAALWFNMGNEEELHHDGSITSTQVQAQLATESTTIKGIYTAGKVIYTVGQVGTDYTRWKNSMGSLDLLGVNLYDFNAQFLAELTQAVADLGSKVFLSEFGYLDESGSDPGGYCDFNSEEDFGATMGFRLLSLRNSGIQAGFIFDFMDSVNCMGMKLTNANYRYAWAYMTGLRRWFSNNAGINVSVTSLRTNVSSRTIAAARMSASTRTVVW